MNEQNEVINPRQKKRELRRAVLFAWFTAIKNAKLYASGHPSCGQSAIKLTDALNEVFQYEMELNIVHTEGLFRMEEDLFIEESLTMYDLLHVLEQAKATRVLFLPGLETEEAMRFVTHLASFGGKEKTAAPAYSSAHIRIFSDTPFDAQLSRQARVFQRLQDTQKIIADWIPRTEALHARLIDEQAISVSDMADPLDEIIDGMHRIPSLYSTALSVQNKNLSLSQHAVSTMIYSLFIGHQLGFDPSLLKMIGLSALCHDIGRHFLPTDFTTDAALSFSDMEIIRLHARDGAAFLAGVHGLPLTLVRVALEHHIGFDGLGYPHLPSGLKPHLISQIVGLSDFVSWRTVSENHYRKPVPPHKMVRCLLRRSGAQFHPLLIKSLLPFLGFYPPGTKVKLSTGEEAIALEPNTRNILRPAVKILGPTANDHRWLSQLPDDQSSFPVSIANMTGFEPNIDPYLSTIPDLFQSPT